MLRELLTGAERHGKRGGARTRRRSRTCEGFSPASNGPGGGSAASSSSWTWCGASVSLAVVAGLMLAAILVLNATVAGTAGGFGLPQDPFWGAGDS